ncbi:MAG: hypothetical protein JKY48_02855 [Flavobacteriales bacterium]|nr:hypothetical protein [Flavobacteriales bacterium]
MVEIIPLNDAFLTQHEVKAWVDSPLWLNHNYCNYSQVLFLDLIGSQKLSFEKSIQASISYYDSIQWPEPKFGINETRRVTLLKSANA